MLACSEDESMIKELREWGKEGGGGGLCVVSGESWTASDGHTYA